ncbi:hypothetical protein BYT27DRAFT_7204797 [Phlegmacium glaucopus]|nr:hypothetical protein BYT27DRAFT_7204797 [Phlegmacium glaucopus]
MTLKKPKPKGGAKSKGVKKKQKDKDAKWKEQNSEEEDEGEDESRFSHPLLLPRLLRQRHSTDLILPVPCSQLLCQDIMSC